MLLGRTVGEHQSGESTFLYSPHPFPGREDGGLRDDFARGAWEALGRDPKAPFYRFETIGERKVLRYATADLMRSSCVACHNSHPDSPKRDWREGDVRGVLEVRLPMHRIEAETRAALQGSVLLAAVGGTLGIGLLGLVISRLRRTGDELAHARDRALGAVRAQNEFLGNVSHELRTPLHAILGYSEMLAEELEDAGQQRLLPDVRRIREAGQSLRELIDDVLEAARLKSETATLECETFDVADLIQEVAASMAELPRGGPVAFEVDCPEDVGSMHADRRKLRRALVQVLSNARKFTERGRITLRAARLTAGGRECLRFEVADTGSGIPPELQGRLFDQFVQADSSAKRRHAGLGLGLSIAASTVRMMGGEISVVSAPGQGSTFTLLVPAGMER
jgi:signal transduction histidine kinase